MLLLSGQHTTLLWAKDLIDSSVCRRAAQVDCRPAQAQGNQLPSRESQGRSYPLVRPDGDGTGATMLVLVAVLMVAGSAAAAKPVQFVSVEAWDPDPDILGGGGPGTPFQFVAYKVNWGTYH